LKRLALSTLVLLLISPMVLADAASQFDLASKPITEEPLYMYNERPWDLHLSGAVGYRHIESNSAIASDHFQYGLVDADWTPAGWPISLAGQLLGSISNESAENNPSPTADDWSGVVQLNLGIRKIFKTSGAIEPFVGGGVTFLTAWAGNEDVNNNIDVEEHDSAFGGWIGGGFYWNLPHNWHIGFEAEYCYAKVDLLGDEFNAGGFLAMILFGYHW